VLLLVSQSWQQFQHLGVSMPVLPAAAAAADDAHYVTDY